MTELLLFVITFIQGIYDCTPETNHVSGVHSVADMAWLQYMVHVMSFPMTTPFYFVLLLSVIHFRLTVYFVILRQAGRPLVLVLWIESDT